MPRSRSLLAALLLIALAGQAALAAEPAGPSAQPTASSAEPAPSAEPPPPSAEPSPAVDPSPASTPEPSPALTLEPSPALGPTPAPLVEASPGAGPDSEPVVGPEPPPAEPIAALPSPATPSAQVIVVLRPGADVDRVVRRAERAHGAKAERQFRSVLRGFSARLSPGQVKELRADPDVVAVVADERLAAADVLAGQTTPTGISRVFATGAPGIRIDGVDDAVDADVAIFDTGIDPTHPDLRVAGGYNCTSSNRADWGDAMWHGSHVAGTVGAIDNDIGVVGVAPGVRLWSVRVLNASGDGYLSWWLCGLDWIAAARDPEDPGRPLIEVVNMSLTAWGSDDHACGTVNNDLFHQAICRVTGLGITVVAAAANDSASATHRKPAAYDEVITVSALADTDGKPGGTGGNRCYDWGSYDVDDTYADFSNYGHDVDLIAPGKCIWSTSKNGRYTYSSGTSMAAPHVAGAAALYLATRPGAPPAEVRWALRYLANRDWRTSTDPDGVPDPLLDVSRLGRLADFAPSASLPPDGLGANEAGATFTIPLALGRQPTFIEPVVLSLAGVPAPIAASLSTTAPLYGSASAASITITVPPSTPAGRYDVIVRAAYRSLRVHDLRITVAVDNEPPVARAPKAAFVAGTRAGYTTAPVRLGWAAAADQSPIVAYELGEAGADGTVSVLASLGGSTRTADRRVATGTRHTYAVRARDRAGNTGAWASGPPVRVVVAQESGTGTSRSSGWTRYTSTHALGGSAIYATRAGAWLRYRFTGAAVALVGARGRTRGAAAIYLDGAYVRTVDAYSRLGGSRWLLFARGLDPTRAHVLEVRLRGTWGRPRFDVDAFLVLR